MGEISQKEGIRFLNILMDAIKSFNAHNGLVYAGNLAFIGFLSVFPFIIVLVGLSTMIGQTDTGTQAIQFMYDNLPQDIAAQIKGPVDRVVAETSGNLILLSIVVALWTTLRGVHSARQAVMKAYGVKFEKVTHALLGQLQNLGIIFALVGLILITLFILVTGPAIIEGIQKFIPISDKVANLWGFGRYLLSPIMLYIAITGLYHFFVPRYGKRGIAYMPGALMTLVIWFAVAGGLSLYLRYLGELNLMYGSLTGVIVLQLFLFFLSFGFILGAELNAQYTIRRANKKSA